MNIQTYIETGTIEPEELYAILKYTTSIKIIDATFILPNSGKSPKENFQKERIDNATFFDIDEIADHNTNLPHMLPNANEFASAVSRLGISNDDFVVIYAQHGMVMGPARAWWMFKVFGHDKVAVLNGGLPAWKTANLPVNTAPASQPSPSEFTAKLNHDLIFSMDEVKAVCNSSTCQIIDARPAGRFAGTEPEPRPDIESGHIEGSINIPCSTLIDANSGKLKPKEELKKLFLTAGYKPDIQVIHSCGSGVTACMNALALYYCGHKSSIGVYDGSWAEWAQKQPISKH